MKTFAVIENNIVTNIIVAEDLEAASGAGSQVVEYTEDNSAHIGLGYQDGIFEQPTN